MGNIYTCTLAVLFAKHGQVSRLPRRLHSPAVAFDSFVCFGALPLVLSNFYSNFLFTLSFVGFGFAIQNRGYPIVSHTSVFPLCGKCEKSGLVSLA